ncbi:unnamed protein product [Calicophoron daubneyi]|uniref:Uncharacterized protein n=1 Tax=Calicophoron daubneyi TaxID=300641 RepID=A0AAV2TMM1_CALDB
MITPPKHSYALPVGSFSTVVSSLLPSVDNMAAIAESQTSCSRPSSLPACGSGREGLDFLSTRSTSPLTLEPHSPPGMIASPETEQIRSNSPLATPPTSCGKEQLQEDAVSVTPMDICLRDPLDTSILQLNSFSPPVSTNSSASFAPVVAHASSRIDVSMLSNQCQSSDVLLGQSSCTSISSALFTRSPQQVDCSISVHFPRLCTRPDGGFRLRLSEDIAAPANHGKVHWDYHLRLMDVIVMLVDRTGRVLYHEGHFPGQPGLSEATVNLSNRVWGQHVHDIDSTIWNIHFQEALKEALRWEGEQFSPPVIYQGTQNRMVKSDEGRISSSRQYEDQSPKDSASLLVHRRRLLDCPIYRAYLGKQCFYIHTFTLPASRGYPGPESSMNVQLTGFDHSREPLIAHYHNVLRKCDTEKDLSTSNATAGLKRAILESAFLDRTVSESPTVCTRRKHTSQTESVCNANSPAGSPAAMNTNLQTPFEMSPYSVKFTASPALSMVSNPAADLARPDSSESGHSALSSSRPYAGGLSNSPQRTAYSNPQAKFGYQDTLDILNEVSIPSVTYHHHRQQQPSSQEVYNSSPSSTHTHLNSTGSLSYGYPKTKAGSTLRSDTSLAVSFGELEDTLLPSSRGCLEPRVNNLVADQCQESQTVIHYRQYHPTARDVVHSRHMCAPNSHSALSGERSAIRGVLTPAECSPLSGSPLMPCQRISANAAQDKLEQKKIPSVQQFDHHADSVFEDVRSPVLLSDSRTPTLLEPFTSTPYSYCRADQSVITTKSTSESCMWNLSSLASVDSNSSKMTPTGFIEADFPASPTRPQSSFPAARLDDESLVFEQQQSRGTPGPTINRSHTSSSFPSCTHVNGTVSDLSGELIQCPNNVVVRSSVSQSHLRAVDGLSKSAAADKVRCAKVGAKDQYGERIMLLQNLLPPEAIQKIRQIWHEIYGNKKSVRSTRTPDTLLQQSTITSSTTAATSSTNSPILREHFARRVRQVVRQYLGPNALVNANRLASQLPLPSRSMGPNEQSASYSQTCRSDGFPISCCRATVLSPTSTTAFTSAAKESSPGTKLSDSPLSSSPAAIKQWTPHCSTAESQLMNVPIQKQQQLGDLPSKFNRTVQDRPQGLETVNVKLKSSPSPPVLTGHPTNVSKDAPGPLSQPIDSIGLSAMCANRNLDLQNTKRHSNSSQCCMLEWLLSEEADLGLLPPSFYDKTNKLGGDDSLGSNHSSAGTQFLVPVGEIVEAHSNLRPEVGFEHSVLGSSVLDMNKPESSNINSSSTFASLNVRVVPSTTAFVTVSCAAGLEASNSPSIAIIQPRISNTGPACTSPAQPRTDSLLVRLLHPTALKTTFTTSSGETNASAAVESEPSPPGASICLEARPRRPSESGFNNQLIVNARPLSNQGANSTSSRRISPSTANQTAVDTNPDVQSKRRRSGPPTPLFSSCLQQGSNINRTRHVSQIEETNPKRRVLSSERGETSSNPPLTSLTQLLLQELPCTMSGASSHLTSTPTDLHNAAEPSDVCSGRTCTNLTPCTEVRLNTDPDDTRQQTTVIVTGDIRNHMLDDSVTPAGTPLTIVCEEPGALDNKDSSGPLIFTGIDHASCPSAIAHVNTTIRSDCGSTSSDSTAVPPSPFPSERRLIAVIAGTPASVTSTAAPKHSGNLSSHNSVSSTFGVVSSSLCRLLLDPHLGPPEKTAEASDNPATPLTSTPISPTPGRITRYSSPVKSCGSFSKGGNSIDVYDFSISNSNSKESPDSRSGGSITESVLEKDDSVFIGSSNEQRMSTFDDRSVGSDGMTGPPSYDVSSSGSADPDGKFSTSSKAIAEEVEFLYEILRRDELECGKGIDTAASWDNTSDSPKAKRIRVMDCASDRTDDGTNQGEVRDSGTDWQADAKAVARICEQLQEGFTTSQASDSSCSHTCSSSVNGEIQQHKPEENSVIVHGESSNYHRPMSTVAWSASATQPYCRPSNSAASHEPNRAALAAARASQLAAATQRTKLASQRSLVEQRKRLIQHQLFNQVTVYSANPVSSNPVDSVLSTSTGGSCSVTTTASGHEGGSHSSPFLSADASPAPLRKLPRSLSRHSSSRSSSSSSQIQFTQVKGLTLTATTVVSLSPSMAGSHYSVSDIYHNHPEELSRFLKEVGPNVQVQLSTAPQNPECLVGCTKATSAVPCAVYSGPTLSSQQSPPTVRSYLSTSYNNSTPAVTSPGYTAVSTRPSTCFNELTQTSTLSASASLRAPNSRTNAPRPRAKNSAGRQTNKTAGRRPTSVSADVYTPTQVISQQISPSTENVIVHGGAGFLENTMATGARVIHQINGQAVTPTVLRPSSLCNTQPTVQTSVIVDGQIYSSQPLQPVGSVQTSFAPVSDQTVLSTGQLSDCNAAVGAQQWPSAGSLVDCSAAGQLTYRTAPTQNYVVGYIPTTINVVQGAPVYNHFAVQPNVLPLTPINPVQACTVTSLTVSKYNPIAHTSGSSGIPTQAAFLYPLSENSIGLATPQPLSRVYVQSSPLLVQASQPQELPQVCSVTASLSNNTPDYIQSSKTMTIARTITTTKHTSRPPPPPPPAAIKLDDPIPDHQHSREVNITAITQSPRQGPQLLLQQPTQDMLLTACDDDSARLESLIQAESRQEESLLPDEIINDVFGLENMFAAKQRPRDTTAFDNSVDQSGVYPECPSGNNELDPGTGATTFPSTASSSPSPCSPRLNSTLPPDGRSYLSP